MNQELASNLNKAYLAYFLLTITALFWSSNIVIARHLNNDMTPISLAFYRWFSASLILLPFAITHLRRDWQTIKANWTIILVLSLLGVSLFNTILYYSSQTTGATNIALIQTSMPIFVVIISFVLYTQKINGGMLSGILIGVGGATLVIFNGELQSFGAQKFSFGDISMLFAVFIYALYSVILHKAPKVHSLSFLIISFIVGTLFLLPFFLLDLNITQSPISIFDTDIILFILYLAIFPSIFAYLFWNYSVIILGAHSSGLFICFIPIFTPIIASLFLNETLYYYHYIGILMTILSVAIVHTFKST